LLPAGSVAAGGRSGRSHWRSDYVRRRRHLAQSCGAFPRAGSVALALALMALMVYNQKHPILDIRHAKGQTIANEIFHQWNSFSRIAVRDYSIFIDADASTGIASFDFAHLTDKEKHELLEQGPALPCNVRPRPRPHHRPRRDGKPAPSPAACDIRRRDQPDHRAHHHLERFST
jgi:hypothetical protein